MVSTNPTAAPGKAASESPIIAASDSTAASLVVLKGPQPGRICPLHGAETIIGRQAEAAICLESPAVSRQHARVIADTGKYFVEDLQSSNGTYLNGKRLRGRQAFAAGDTLQIGPYVFNLRLPAAPRFVDTDVIIRDQVNADPAHRTLHGDDARNKLNIVLEIAQHLAHTLDPEALLGKLLDHLMALFPQADRAIVLMCEGDALVVKAQRTRRAEDFSNFPYSRTVVRRALQEGMGILSEDLGADQRFQSSATVASLNLRSLMCVPLICQDGRRLGALQMDSLRPGRPFQKDDLQLVTAVGLQAAVVLDNAALHAEVLREERLRRELAFAREIQNGFLPTNFPGPEQGFELFAGIHPAREVSGDVYDFFPLKGNCWAFFVGDVAGKGIPAALFIIAVRSLSRYIAMASSSPAETLERLNAALAVDNVSGIFVTMLHGIYYPSTGETVLASGGHPVPLLRRKDGRVEEVAMPNGRFLGMAEEGFQVSNVRLHLQPGETLFLYTDGLTEPHATDGETMFGVERLKEALQRLESQPSLESYADSVKAAVEEFTCSTELQDDQTLFILRRSRIQ